VHKGAINSLFFFFPPAEKRLVRLYQPKRTNRTSGRKATTGELAAADYKQILRRSFGESQHSWWKEARPKWLCTICGKMAKHPGPRACTAGAPAYGTIDAIQEKNRAWCLRQAGR
jgi:hypothetical protein